MSVLAYSRQQQRALLRNAAVAHEEYDDPAQQLLVRANLSGVIAALGRPKFPQLLCYPEEKPNPE